MYTFMSINGSSGSCHPRRDAELIPICNRLLTDLHVIRKMKLICVTRYSHIKEPILKSCYMLLMSRKKSSEQFTVM